MGHWTEHLFGVFGDEKLLQIMSESLRGFTKTWFYLIKSEWWTFLKANICTF